jgi:hypothetical protein
MAKGTEAQEQTIIKPNPDINEWGWSSTTGPILPLSH